MPSVTSETNRFLSDDSSLALYLKEISKHKTLSLEEEAKQAVRIREGDKRLWRNWLKLICALWLAFPETTRTRVCH